MRARIAAVAVFVGGICALLLILGQSGTNSLFASVQEKLKEVRTVTFDVSVRLGDEPATVTRLKLLGRDLGRAERPNGYFEVFDRKQRKIMRVMPDAERALILTNVKFEDENRSPNIFDMLLGISESSVERLEDREIDGKKLNGFVAEITGQKMNVWVDPATKLPVRIEGDINGGGDPLCVEFGNFVYDAKLDPAQFRIEPPKGYQVESRDVPEIEAAAIDNREERNP